MRTATARSRRPRPSWSRIARSRHRPARTCIGCGRSLPKDELLRLVRAADGAVRPDPAARADGRGAYVCARPECAEALGAERTLGHAFRAPVTVQPQLIDLVKEWQRSASTK